MADRDSGEDSLFREIKDELRQEQAARLWKKYGNYVIGAALLLVIGVGGYQAWRSYERDRRAEDSMLFANALQAVTNEQPDEAAAILSKLAESGSPGYATLARFDRAAIEARGGANREAAAMYLAIAQDGDVGSALRNLALLLSVLHELDSGDPGALMDRIAPLAESSNPWRHAAKELTALLAQRAGDTQRAATLFRELADDATAPSGIRSRAAEMSAILGS